jgi:hypothetical protein
MFDPTINEMKFEYEEAFLPNVLVEWIKPDPNETPRAGRMINDKWPIEVDDMLKKLLIVLATKNPAWKFVFKSNRHSAATRWVRENNNAENTVSYKYLSLSSAYIFDGKEFLGAVSKVRGRSSVDAYYIENERVSKERSRGSGATTKDLKKAIRLVEKMFGSKTVEERIDAVREDLGNIVDHVNKDRSRRYEDTFRRATKGMRMYMLKNWGTLSKIALENGGDPQAIDSLLTVRNEAVLAKGMYKCWENENGRVVLIHGNDYVVRSKQEGEEKRTHIYSQTDVPEDIKRGIGMLKLVDVKFYIENVGIRIDDNAFFLPTAQEVDDE